MKTLNVLFVEDDHHFAELLIILMERDGHAVVHVGTVAGARREMAAAAFSAAILDFRLPDGDAGEIMTTLEAANAVTPVLMVSAETNAPAKMTGHAVRRFFSKPLDTKAFRAELAGIAAAVL